MMCVTFENPPPNDEPLIVCEPIECRFTDDDEPAMLQRGAVVYAMSFYTSEEGGMVAMADVGEDDELVTIPKSALVHVARAPYAGFIN